MKKFLVLFLTLAVFLLAGCGEATISKIEVEKESIPENAIVEEFELSTIKLVVTKSDDTTSKVDLTKEMLSEEDNSNLTKAGTYTITVNYEGLTTTFEITLINKVIKHKVTFKDFDDKVLKEVEVEDGKAATAPANPEREGYTFKGWDVQFDNVKADLVVKAVYDIKKYSVKFMDGDTKVSEIFVEHGGNGEMVKVPEKTGYTCKWDKTLDDLKNVTSDMTVNLICTPNVYTVKFMNGETLVKEVKVEYGKGVLEIPAVPEKVGAMGKWDKTNAELEKITADLVVNAIYTTNFYTVKFMNGTELVKEVKVEHGKDLTALPKVPEKAGYTGKWDKKVKNVTGNLTVNAVYTINEYSVKFMNDKTLVLEVKVKYNENVTKLADLPTKEGYNVSWDKTLEQLKNIKADTVVNAVFTIKKFTVTFKAGETVVSTVEVEYGKGITKLPEVPTKEGYKGVWDKLEITNVKANLTVNAVYTKLYTVSFKNGTEVVKEVQVVENGSILKADMPQVPTKAGYKVTWDMEEVKDVKANVVVNAVFTKYTISEILETGTYAVDANVVAVSTKGALLTDGTTYIYAYMEGNVNVKAGDKVAVEGYVNIYPKNSGVLQFNKPTVTYIEDGTVTAPKANELTVEKLNAIYEAKKVEIGLVTVKGTYVKDGSYHNVNVKGTEAVISLDGPQDELMAGVQSLDNVIITGYALSFNYRYVNILVTKVEKVPFTNEEKLAKATEEITAIDGNKVNKNIEFIPGNTQFGTTYTWKSNNTTVISNEGVYTAPAADTQVTLTVDVKAGTELLGTITITVTAVKKAEGGNTPAGDPYEFTFTKSFKAGANTFGNLAWNLVVTAPKGEFYNFNNDKGCQVGSSKKATTEFNLSTEAYVGGVSTIKVNASTASGGTAKLKVLVNGIASDEISLTTTATDYTFETTGAGKIEIVITNTQKAFYVKSIAINPATPAA